MRRIALLIMIALATPLAGCGSFGLMGSSDEKAEDESTAENGQSSEEEEIEDPNRVSGVLDDVSFGDGGDDGGAATKQASANSAEVTELRQEIARLRSAMGDKQPRRRPASAGSRTGPGVAVVFPRGAGLRAPMLSALNQAAGSFPLRVITPGEVTPVLDNSGCSASAPSDCLSALAVQSGARLLAVVEPQSATNGSERRIRFQYYDTDLGLRYDPVTLTLPQGDSGGPAEQSWIAAADAVLLHGQDHLQLTPTIVHAVKTEGETVYLNQGTGAGLEQGTRLAVHNDGRVIRGPADLPVTWVPGQSVGVVEITRVTENGRAVGRVIEGTAPEPADFLIPAEGKRG